MWNPINIMQLHAIRNFGERFHKCLELLQINFMRPTSRGQCSGHSRQGAAGAGSGCSLLFEQCPVKGVVVLVIKGAKEDPEKLTEVHVVGCLLKPQTPTVVQIHCKFRWETLGEQVGWGGVGGKWGEQRGGGGSRWCKWGEQRGGGGSRWCLLEIGVTGFQARQVAPQLLYSQDCIVLTLHKTSMGVDNFFSLIFSYFCFFVAACVVRQN